MSIIAIRLRSHSEIWPKSDFFFPLREADVIVLWQREQHKSHGIRFFSKSDLGHLCDPTLNRYQNLMQFSPHSRSTFIITVRSRESQTETNIIAKSNLCHSETLDAICLTEAIHIIIPQLRAPTLHPHPQLQ